MVYNYFTAMKNSSGVPLAYIIRNTPALSDIVVDREQEIIKNASLQGNMFSRKTKKVVAILKELTVDTDSKTWMKGKRCGQEEMLALQNHYDGKSEGGHRKRLAKDGL